MLCLNQTTKSRKRNGICPPTGRLSRAIDRKHQKKTNRLCATSALSLREQHMSQPEHLLQHRTDANTQTASTRSWMLSESLIFIIPKPFTCIKLYSPLPLHAYDRILLHHTLIMPWLSVERTHALDFTPTTPLYRCHAMPCHALPCHTVPIFLIF
jgi:hypothetical protein